MERIRDFIKDKGKIERKDVLARFYRVAEPAKLLDLLMGLVTAEEIDMFIENGRTFYSSHSTSRHTNNHKPKIDSSAQEDLNELKKFAEEYDKEGS
jgi:heme oxygenase